VRSLRVTRQEETSPNSAADMPPDGAGMGLRVRVGIATGLVVVGDLLGEGAAQEHQAIGETPNRRCKLRSCQGLTAWRRQCGKWRISVQRLAGNSRTS
jgi:class 3 adenylate cyclase